MRVGFTGTREGMTPNQRSQFWSWLGRQGMTEFHHGCCIGADVQAATLAFVTDPLPRVIGHPGDTPHHTSREAREVNHETLFRRHNLDRNKDIVNATDVLAVCPKGPEELRSGTWSTVRYARKTGKPVVIFWPDGTVTEEK